LAFGLRTQFTSGDLPFFELPSLGGSDAGRGFIAGRWRDRASWIASVEHRFWLLPRGFPIPFTDAIRVERFGAAVFYEVGAVAEDGAALFKSHVRSSYGFGLRASLERAAPFRVDIGFSKDGVNVSAGFGLSF
jgi:hemolysin activation/secretion protein